MFKNERLQYLTLQTKIPDKIRMILFYAVIKDCNWHTQTWVGKTKSKDWRVVYLSHLSNLSSNSKTARTEVLTSDSQVPSTFHHHVQVVTSDKARIIVRTNAYVTIRRNMMMRQTIMIKSRTCSSTTCPPTLGRSPQTMAGRKATGKREDIASFVYS